jgi:tetratricopeptide (TPR) repeat protein
MATVAEPIDYHAKLATYPELRDRRGWREELGLDVTTSSDECCRLLDLAFRAAFTRSAPRYHALDAAKIAAAAVRADDSCPMAHVAALALRCIGGSKANVHPALAAATAACAAGCSEWERRHLEVVTEYASADDGAVGDLYTAIVQDFPFDTLALSLAFIHNSPARRAALLDNSGAAMATWAQPTSSEPGDLYPFLLAEHAYSLGENEQYEESERFARQALELEPTCALATHQMAHIFEMTGRSEAGSEFLAATEQDWNLGGQATHIYWHWGVLHVEHGAHAEALALYEKTFETAKRDDASGARSMGKCLNDLASLLFRLHLDGLEPERTANLAAEVLALPSVAGMVGRSTGSAALDVHMTMLLSLVGRQSEAELLQLDSAATDTSAVSVRFAEASALTTALCAAIVAYTTHDYTAASKVLEELATDPTAFWEASSGVEGVPAPGNVYLSRL